MRIDPKHISDSMTTDLELDLKVASVVSRVRFNVASGASATNTTFTAVGNKFVWINSRNTKLKNGTLIFRILQNGASRTTELRLVNITTGEVVTTLSLLTTTPTQFMMLSFANPIADASLELQIRKTVTGGSAHILETVDIEFDAN